MTSRNVASDATKVQLRVIVSISVWLITCAPPPSTLNAASLEQARRAAAQVDQAALMRDVEMLSHQHLADVKFIGRQTTDSQDRWHNQSFGAARAMVRTRFAQLGLVVTEQVDTQAPETVNIIGEIRGTSLPDEVVLVGAHYDAFWGGADDNSTGLAGMLEIARLMSAHPLRRTVRFVAFDKEENGNIGSDRLVAAGTRVAVALILDSLGYRDRTEGSQQSLPGFSVPSTADFIAGIANETSRSHLEEMLDAAHSSEGMVPVQGIVAPGTGDGPLTSNLMRCDHAAFWRSGQIAVFLTDTTNFRNPNYHTANDLPETLDPEFFAGVVRIAALATFAWAER